MPPYKPVVSQAQGREMFVLAEKGQISKQDAIGKVRAAGGMKGLPEKKSAMSKVKKKRKQPALDYLGGKK